jgi:hypothetical protein
MANRPTSSRDEEAITHSGSTAADEERKLQLEALTSVLKNRRKGRWERCKAQQRQIKLRLEAFTSVLKNRRKGS